MYGVDQYGKAGEALICRVPGRRSRQRESNQAGHEQAISKRQCNTGGRHHQYDPASQREPDHAAKMRLREYQPECGRQAGDTGFRHGDGAGVQIGRQYDSEKYANLASNAGESCRGNGRRHAALQHGDADGRRQRDIQQSRK